MSLVISFRPALATDAVKLSRLALRSKAYWGYPQDFMLACEEELAVSAQAIEDGETHYEVALDQQRLIGFYALEDLCDGEIELGALFVDPPYIGQGVGRQLMARARSCAAQLGARVLKIQGDPHALAFYRAAGAELCGERESGSIPGRMLPLLRIELHAQGDARATNPRQIDTNKLNR